MYYIAYGSNINIVKLSNRIGSDNFTFLNVIELKDYKLYFNKISKDNSGKANIVNTLNSIIYCNLYEIKPDVISKLDKIEGYKYGYDKLYLDSDTFTYIATNTSDSIKPYDWYLHTIIDGMISFNYPKWYIDEILLTEYLIDNDINRKLKNYSHIQNFDNNINVFFDKENFKFKIT